MIEVPRQFAAEIVAREGAAGQQWLDRLPDLAERYCTRWELTADGEPLHGIVALVLPVRMADGTPAMLKLSWRDAETEHEAMALALWNGRGAVRLLANDSEEGTLLLERLEPDSLLEAEIEEAVSVAGAMLRRLAVPAPPGPRSLTELAQRWRGELPAEDAELGHPIPGRLLAAAVAFCDELGPTAGKWLVNEDMHFANVLRGHREPWLVIDPKVVVGDPEFGLIPLLWNRFKEMDGRAGLLARFTALVEAGDLDKDLARAWTVVRGVDNWLWSLKNRMTDAADVCAAIVRGLVP
ncbi:aminoglycoside phosphotransferase family protein [Goodfellowiella coeruleoviolacea]|uniref:Streptomycin 6-kinase n=1 Tax=Goodfellowiella coeruleoviolacea TaxID=334858 RepID=A0AAE3GC60_9PSEU|nr:aminoglycoside phosphotransferase family protein [Goodfellowiella coeruleoviolacea]MCP2165572.1 streptomycin 6-kinase [Goodfellowiella coeruleoviolacea]